MRFSRYESIEEFFATLPVMDAQFGNLITLREKDGDSNPGLQQCFLSSVMQFQPLLEISVYDPQKRKLVFSRAEEQIDPCRRVIVFISDEIEFVQKVVVKDDQLLLDLSLKALNGAKIDGYTVLFSGACLFSPQGIPYHWEDEGKITLDIRQGNAFFGIWNNLRFSLQFSQQLSDLWLRKIQSDDVEKEIYFSSFNLKKRYTYWVKEESRIRNDESGLEKISERNVGYGAQWEPCTSADGCARLSVCFSVFPGDSEKMPDLQENQNSFEAFNSSVRSKWVDFYNSIPRFHAKEKAIERMYNTSWYILKAGRIEFPENRLKFPFTSVNKFHYYNQFFWDSAFQNIALIWENTPDAAESEMKNFVSNQWRNGMIPYELFMYPVNGREWMDGDGLTSGTTQPPVIGITLREVYNKFGNNEYLLFFFDCLVRYENWLSLYRDLGNRGLAAYVNIWETGWDNSPRFDKAARNRVLDPYVEGVDFNVYIYLMRDTILEIAHILGKPEPDGIRERQRRTKDSMNSLMYSDIDGFYYDLEAGTDIKIPVKTAAGLLPLLTDIPSPEQKERLITRYVLSEKEFLTGTPIPSVSRSEPSYVSYDFWRGANWPQITWSIIYGLQNEYPDVAAEILDRFLSHTMMNENCYEYYDSETGQGAGLPFQGWGALYIDFINRYVVGIHPDLQGFQYKPISRVYQEFMLDNLEIKGIVFSITHELGTCTFEVSGFGTFAMPEKLRFNAVLNEECPRFEFDGPDVSALVCVTGKHEWRGNSLRFFP